MPVARQSIADPFARLGSSVQTPAGQFAVDYGRQVAQAANDYSTILSGYLEREAASGSIGANQLREAQEYYDRLAGQTDAQAIRRGLSNTTIRNALQAGVNRQRDIALNAIQNDIANRRLNLILDRLGYMERDRARRDELDLRRQQLAQQQAQFERGLQHDIDMLERRMFPFGRRYGLLGGGGGGGGGGGMRPSHDPYESIRLHQNQQRIDLERDRARMMRDLELARLELERERMEQMQRTGIDIFGRRVALGANDWENALILRGERPASSSAPPTQQVPPELTNMLLPSIAGGTMGGLPGLLTAAGAVSSGGAGGWFY